MPAAIPPRLIKSACGVFALSAVVASATPECGHAPAFALGLTPADVPDAESMLYDDGPHLAAHADWMKFETDGCGTLERVKDSRSMLTQSAFDDGMDDLDEDDPLDSGRTLIGQWLSEHAEAVISDIPDKSCDDSEFDGGDEDTFEIA